MHLNACDICKKMISGDYVSIEYRSQKPFQWKKYDVCPFCFRKNPSLEGYLTISADRRMSKKSKR